MEHGCESPRWESGTVPTWPCGGALPSTPAPAGGAPSRWAFVPAPQARAPSFFFQALEGAVAEPAPLGADALLLLRGPLSRCGVPAVQGRPRQAPGPGLGLGAAWSLSRPAVASAGRISR